jgi:hypothetical protein
MTPTERRQKTNPRMRKAAALRRLILPDNYEDGATVRQQIEDYGGEATAALSRSDKERRRIELMADMLGEDGNDPAFLHSAFCMVALPASKPADDTKPHYRENGRLSLLINPTWIPRRGGDPVISGIPYGTRARLILVYLQTEALRTQSPTVGMGANLSDWMRSVGIESITGGKRGTIGKVHEQAKRLGYSTFTLSWQGDDGTENVVPNERIINRLKLWQGSDPDQGMLWPQEVELSRAFFDNLKDHAVPISREAISRLRKSSLAMDLYVWTAYKLPRLRKNVPITWEFLHSVFGAEYTLVRQFKAKAIDALRTVQAAYPDARFEITEGGLLIKPSPPAIPRKGLFIPRGKA